MGFRRSDSFWASELVFSANEGERIMKIKWNAKVGESHKEYISRENAKSLHEYERPTM
jgi:hypothetical protein